MKTRIINADNRLTKIGDRSILTFGVISYHIYIIDLAGNIDCWKSERTSNGTRV